MADKVTSIRSQRKRTPPAPEPQALQVLIVLTQTNPLIWRRIQVPGTYSFWDLHVAIQDAMGWQDCHLHEFRLRHPRRGTLDRLGIPDPDGADERPCTADWDVPLSEYFNWETFSDAPPARYLYDFGDGWHHLVTVETMLSGRSARLPRCVAGAGACPPEDCGGVHGFEEFQEAIANRKHPRHAELMRWSGGEYDPRAFDPKAVVFDDPRQRWTTAFQR